MSSRVINGVPRVAQFIGDSSYLTCYVGSLWAALQGAGLPRAYPELLALSGAGNRLAWRPGTWDPGNVDLAAVEEPALAPHLRVLAALGLTGEYRATRPLPGLDGPFVSVPTAIDEITDSIDRGVPVIAFGVVGPPEACVVFGYEDDGDRLVGWNYFQAEGGFAEAQPFVKEWWFADMWGYLLLGDAGRVPDERTGALAAMHALADHAHHGPVRGRAVGLAAWDAMLDQLEHDDFAGLPTLLADAADPDHRWDATLQGRFYVYCDALCQIHERGVALPYWNGIAERHPDWARHLRPAIDDWRECASYGGFLWQYLTMDAAGFQRFASPEIRAILAKEGHRCAELDARAVSRIEGLLAG